MSEPHQHQHAPAPAAPESRVDVWRKRFYAVGFSIGIIALFYVLGFVLDVLSTPVAVILWTALFVLLLYGPVNSLERRGIPRVWGTAIAYVAMLAIIGAAVALMFSPIFGLGDQFINMLRGVPTYVQSFTEWLGGLRDTYFADSQNERLEHIADSFTTSLTGWASQLATVSASSLLSVGEFLFNAIFAIAFALIVAFWLLTDLPAIGRELLRLVPPARREEATMLRVTVTHVMGGYIKATLLQCFIIGLGCGIAYAIIGIPNPAALGLITGILNIIPVVGPWFGGAMAAVVGLMHSAVAALIALIVTIVIQQFVYSIVSPKIMADSVDVHPALVIISMLVGGAIGGAMGGLSGTVLGMLLSIPFAAIIKALFVFYFERQTGSQLVSEDGVFFKGEPFRAEDAAGDAVDALGDAMAPKKWRDAARSREVMAAIERAGALSAPVYGAALRADGAQGQPSVYDVQDQALDADEGQESSAPREPEGSMGASQDAAAENPAAH